MKRSYPEGSSDNSDLFNPATEINPSSYAHTVAIAFFIRSGKILLEKRSKMEETYAGVWVFPGGHRKSRETLEETLEREMCEELSVKVIRPKLIGKVHDVDKTSNLPFLHYAFLCTEWAGRISGTKEGESLAWIPVSGLPRLSNVSSLTWKILAMAPSVSHRP